MRTMIVDDEHIVRKGLIHTTPWSRYGFEIVAEAENGARALERLREGGVDVLITDLTMPVMSGFELMRAAREEMPELYIVVLTCHHDFAFAQEALQIGAIDYMVKTQLSERVLEESLQRIADRIAQEKRLHPAKGRPEGEGKEWEAVLVPASGDRTRALPAGLQELSSELPGGGRIVRRVPEDDPQRLLALLEAADGTGSWRLMTVEPLSAGEAKGDTRASVARGFFYKADSDPRILAHLSRTELLELREPPPAAELERLEKEWTGFRWIYDERRLDDWLSRVAGQKPEPAWIRGLLERSWSVWKHLKPLQGLSGDVPHTWAECRKLVLGWLPELRSPAATAEAGTAIYQALEHMRTEAAHGMLMEDAARKVGLSRGYFGQCFRPLTGRSYHELLTILRIEASARMLADTNELIYAVAEQAGFKDEKYFRTVFKQVMGINPGEYRTRMQAGAQSGKPS
ncbi:response regulator [Paenibacillus albicereus]|uniref:Response regulator n=1 Tax=Paenibacillus albicereus TaxID=2726185 RepID=A0A6H2GVU0_9BACL|nr:response regulator [Paenibacillus albicereus]QJC51515.1 response regulator [Paenibacillus albicereus]